MKLLNGPRRQEFPVGGNTKILGYFFVVIDFEMHVHESSVFSVLRFESENIELRGVRVWQHVINNIYICGYQQWRKTTNP